MSDNKENRKKTSFCELEDGLCPPGPLLKKFDKKPMAKNRRRSEKEEIYWRMVGWDDLHYEHDYPCPKCGWE